LKQIAPPNEGNGASDGKENNVQVLPRESLKTVKERKQRKKKKSVVSTRTFEVEVIPAKKLLPDRIDQKPRIRVAAYCRVSTDEEEQESSFELQVEHYTKFINAHEDWELAGIYADKGLSGTQVKHREQFLKMIEDCKHKKIDKVITKSISRFARNVYECLKYIRELKELKPPVGITFEKENIDSLDEKSDVFLTMLASFAQEESRSISANIRWAIRNRMKEGTQKVVTGSLYGYDTDDDGNMVIVEPEAEIVQMIFREFVKGKHPADIADKLNETGVTTVLGNPWKTSSIKGILRNEKYCGDVIMQKTITIDYLTHKTKKNEGELDQYYIKDHHEPIIQREIWEIAQDMLEMLPGRHRKKRKKAQRLVPVTKGLLKGFIPIRPEWKTVSHLRLWMATCKAMGEGQQFIIDAEASESEEIKWDY
jgi:site-specific DNA recombinase